MPFDDNRTLHADGINVAHYFRMENTRNAHIEYLIDEALDGSFPASDPPSFSPLAFTDPIRRVGNTVACVDHDSCEGIQQLHLGLTKK